MIYRISFYNDDDVLTSVFAGSPRAADELVDQLNEKNPDAMASRSDFPSSTPKNKGEWIRFLNFAVAQQIDLGGAA
jgi:hypothetical protein